MRMQLCISTVLMLCFCLGARAGDRFAGLYNSPKGFGLSFCTERHESSFNTYSAVADLTGVITGEHSAPGIYFNYSRNTVLRSGVKGDALCVLYAGPGVSAGYLRDAGKESYGAMVALSGTLGGRFLFGDRIALDLSINADLGVHLREKDHKGDGIGLFLYKNGLFRTILPQLKIEYRF